MLQRCFSGENNPVDYVFLEVNQGGQWGWVEKLTNLPISEAIARLLITLTKNEQA